MSKIVLALPARTNHGRLQRRSSSRGWLLRINAGCSTALCLLRINAVCCASMPADDQCRQSALPSRVRSV
jgi:hypothetical protein